MTTQKMRILLTFISFSMLVQAQVTGLAGWDIFLDPGHSQSENMGIYNYSEAEKNLHVALNLRELLLTLTDIDTVYLSRTNSTDKIELSQRSDWANAKGAQWFHSIHSDAGSPTANSTLLLWGQYSSGAEKIPNGGHAMSDVIVKYLTAGMRTNTRGAIGDCSFYGGCNGGPYLSVNYRSTMPSELSEAGFHTNPRQNQLNMNAEWKRLEAWTFFWSFLEFHAIERPRVRICAGIVSDDETGIPVNDAQLTLIADETMTYVTDDYASLFHKYSSDPDQLHNGFYYFENVPGDSATIVVTADKYMPDTARVAMVDSFFTFQDFRIISTRSPYILETTPIEGESRHPAWNPIVIEFSRPMDTLSVNQNLQISPAIALTLTWGSSGRRLSITSGEIQFETDYVISVGGAARDIYGHPFDGNADGTGGDVFQLSFRTGGEDLTGPVVQNTTPQTRDSGVELKPIINVVFDEIIDTASITDEVFRVERFSDHSAVSGSIRFYTVGNRTVMCFFPDAELEADNTYSIMFKPGIKDLFGNETSLYKTVTFKTTAYAQNYRTIDGFESGLASNWWEPQKSGSNLGMLTDSTSRTVNTEFVNLSSGSQKSMKLKYGWDTAASEWLIREYLGGGAPRNISFNSNYQLQVYVFGDGSGNCFRFALDDHLPASDVSYHEVSPWYVVDWIGWKLVSWDLSTGETGTWLGDGVLNGTLRIDSIQLTYTPGSPIIGTFYFDDLRLAQKVMVGITDEKTAIPENFRLYQNYPNPFNPNTTIRFSLPESSPVKISVFDLQGNLVRSLLNEERPAGTHAVTFTAAGLPSGMYIYKLEAGTFRTSLKMMLMK